MSEVEEMSEELCDNCVLNYWAGFIDGEGSIYIVKYEPYIFANDEMRYHYGLRVNVSNNCRFILEEIQDAFGGSLIKKNERYSQLTLSSYEAVELLEALLPFLQIKKEQAKLGIEFQKIKVKHSLITEEIIKQYESYHQKMRELNAIYGRVILYE